MLPLEVDSLAGPQIADDGEELVSARVAGVLVQEVSVGALLGTLPAGDDVDQQAPLGLALERGAHLRGQGGGVEAGAERYEELQSLRDAAEHCGGQPGILAERAGRRQRADEPQLFGGTGDLAEVGDGRLSSTGDRALCRPVTTTDDVPAVAGGGEEPVERDAARAVSQATPWPGIGRIARDRRGRG